MLPPQLQANLIQYSQLSQETILSSLLSLKIPPSSLLYFNRQLQQTLKLSFTQIVQKNNITDLCSLLQILLISKQRGVRITNKTILNIFQWSIQCLSQQYIIKIIQLLISKYKCLIKLQQNDINTIHKIINSSLKIIQNKPQNYIIRGKLHILLTNILKIAHPSGLKQLNNNKKYIHRCLTFQQYQLYYTNSPISYEFYHKYWQLYKKISIHPQEDQMFVNKFNNFTQKLHNQSTTTNPNPILNANTHIHPNLTITKKQTQQLLKILMSFHHFIQNIQKLLKQVITYFKNHPILHNKTNQNQNYNIQFDITLTVLPSYLLKYQHNQQFRIILMTQVQGYYIQLQQFISQILQKVKQKINGKIILGDHNKQNNIQKIRQFVPLIQQSMKNIQNLYLGYMYQIIGRQKLQNLRKFMKLFFNNQKIWEKIKSGNKKDMIKILLPSPNLQNNNNNYKNNKLCMSQSIKNDSIVIDVNSSQNQVLNQSVCYRKILEIKSQVVNKLCITIQNTQKFLNNNTSSIKIKKRPNTTSFAYYYTNANLCLQSFDWQNNTQVFFQNQKEYNIFQWKAMRSLSRENIKGIDIIGEDNQGNKNDGKRRRLKLLAFMEEYQSELRMPQKRVKLNIETQAEDSQR